MLYYEHNVCGGRVGRVGHPPPRQTSLLQWKEISRKETQNAKEDSCQYTQIDQMKTEIQMKIWFFTMNITYVVAAVAAFATHHQQAKLHVPMYKKISPY